MTLYSMKTNNMADVFFILHTVPALEVLYHAKSINDVLLFNVLFVVKMKSAERQIQVGIFAGQTILLSYFTVLCIYIIHYIHML